MYVSEKKLVQGFEKPPPLHQNEKCNPAPSSIKYGGWGGTRFLKIHELDEFQKGCRFKTIFISYQWMN